MKIGFDISQTGKMKAGCGFFSDSLIRHLALIDSTNQYVLYPTFGNHFWDPHFQETCKFDQSNFSEGFHPKNHFDAASFWQTPPEEIEKKLGAVDILHANNFFCPTQLQKTRLVYTLYDLSFFEYPDCTTEANRLACFEGIFKASLHADLIISISEFTRQHFLANFPHYPKERIAVAHLGSRFSEKKEAPSVPPQLSKFQPQQFWLSVGTLEPRKNIRCLLRTFAKLVSQQATPYPLLLAGKSGWLEENIEDFIAELGLSSHVHVLGYVSENDLAWLYANCFCFVYPSLFEGFGLPVLEAMEFGAPVITSNASSLPEVAGNAAILINPQDEEALLQALLRISNNATYREELKVLSQNQARQFSWKNTAKTVLNLYQKVIHQPKYTSTEIITTSVK